MNICFLLRYFPIYGGGETVTLQLAKKFALERINVFVIYLWDSEDTVDLSTFDNIIPIKLCHIHGPKNVDEIDIVDYNEMSIQLRKLLDKRKIDIIINQWWPSKIVYEANQGYAKIVKCHHTSIINYTRKKAIARKICGKKFYEFLLKKKLYSIYKDDFELSDRWVLLSENMLKEAELFLDDVQKQKTVIINNPCKYLPEEEEILNKKEKLFLFVGRLDHVKHIDFLINSWKKLHDYVEENDWKFVIIGDGHERTYLQNLVDSENDNIEFVGQSDPKPLLERAALLGLSSRTEGWPLVLIEAMANGCVPVALNTFGSLKEVIEDNVCGKVVDGDEESYSQMLLSLMQDSSQRVFMAQKALARSRKFTINSIYEQWNILFDILMSEN